jgi:hypothetical protein
MKKPRVRARHKRKNPAFKGATIPVPDGHLFCVFCGGSHPKAEYETNEAGETIMVQREMCVQGKRQLIGLAFSQFIQKIINEVVK